MGIILKTKTSSLHLETINKSNWCKVHLLNDNSIYLGADNFQIIKERIIGYLKGIDIEEKTVYKSDEMSVVWITSLSEEHCVLYGSISQKDESLKIIIQDKHGRSFAKLDVDKNDVENWIEELNKRD